MRRAIILRILLNYGRKEDATRELKIDPGLLTALLEVGHYRNGARSMQKLVEQIIADGSPVPSRAGLPHREIVEMLVQEADEFSRTGSTQPGLDRRLRRLPRRSTSAIGRRTKKRGRRIPHLPNSTQTATCRGQSYRRI